MSQLINEPKNTRGLGADLRDGLIPVGVFVGITGTTIAVTALARFILSSVGYDIQRVINLTLTGLGFLSAVILYIVTIRHSWRLAEACETQGLLRNAQYIRGALVFGSLLLLVPLLLGVLLPQHPAILASIFITSWR